MKLKENSDKQVMEYVVMLVSDVLSSYSIEEQDKDIVLWKDKENNRVQLNFDKHMVYVDAIDSDFNKVIEEQFDLNKGSDVIELLSMLY